MKAHQEHMTASAFKAHCDKPIEQNENKLAHQIDTDLQDNLPPQLLAVVVGVLKIVEKL